MIATYYHHGRGWHRRCTECHITFFSGYEEGQPSECPLCALKAEVERLMRMLPEARA